MAVSVTGPRAVNELGGPVIPGNLCHGSKAIRNIITLTVRGSTFDVII